ncbi:MAG TPA: type II secretion system F family protein [Jatrophihabitans sp.]|nr:type II secretion system F family protein [Jatrophihabitans sp.]
MTPTLLVTGLGLMLANPVPPGRRRLAALAGTRLPAPQRVVGANRFARLPRAGTQLLLSLIVFGSVVPLAGPVPALLAAAAGWVGLIAWRQLGAERIATAERARLVEVVSALAAEQATGASVTAALASVAADAGPWQASFDRAARLASLGRDPAAALAEHPPLRPLAIALGMAGQTGAGLSQVLPRLRSDAQSRQRSRRALAAAVAGPRASAFMLAGLPVLGLMMGAALGAHPIQLLTATVPGLVALSVGTGFELAGVLWVLRLTR